MSNLVDIAGPCTAGPFVSVGMHGHVASCTMVSMAMCQHASMPGHTCAYTLISTNGHTHLKGMCTHLESKSCKIAKDLDSK